MSNINGVLASRGKTQEDDRESVETLLQTLGTLRTRLRELGEDAQRGAVPNLAEQMFDIADDLARAHGDMRALLTQILLQGKAWQPMETAPRDGTSILVLAADGERFVGCWKRGGWELFGAYARIEPVLLWMPLPDPPSAETRR